MWLKGSPRPALEGQQRHRKEPPGCLYTCECVSVQMCPCTMGGVVCTRVHACVHVCAHLCTNPASDAFSAGHWDCLRLLRAASRNHSRQAQSQPGAPGVTSAPLTLMPASLLHPRRRFSTFTSKNPALNFPSSTLKGYVSHTLLIVPCTPAWTCHGKLSPPSAF